MELPCIICPAYTADTIEVPIEQYDSIAGTVQVHVCDYHNHGHEFLELLIAANILDRYGNL